MVIHSLKSNEWNQEKTERVVINLCSNVNKFGSRLTLDDFKNDSDGSLIPDLNNNTGKSVIESLKKKIKIGLENRENESFLHTGPHHDDITTGYLPFIAHLVRSPLNRHHFCTLTSGFTAVTNEYLIDALVKTKQLFDDIRNLLGEARTIWNPRSSGEAIVKSITDLNKKLDSLLLKMK